MELLFLLRDFGPPVSRKIARLEHEGMQQWQLVSRNRLNFRGRLFFQLRLKQRHLEVHSLNKEIPPTEYKLKEVIRSSNVE